MILALAYPPAIVQEFGRAEAGVFHMERVRRSVFIQIRRIESVSAGRSSLVHAPSGISERAQAWALRDWNDPKRRKAQRTPCDDILHPFASHADCDAMRGTYHEGQWIVFVFVQRLTKDAPLRVQVGEPAPVR